MKVPKEKIERLVRLDGPDKEHFHCYFDGSLLWAANGYMLRGISVRYSPSDTPGLVPVWAIQMCRLVRGKMILNPADSDIAIMHKNGEHVVSFPRPFAEHWPKLIADFKSKLRDPPTNEIAFSWALLRSLMDFEPSPRTRDEWMTVKVLQRADHMFLELQADWLDGITLLMPMRIKDSKLKFMDDKNYE